MTRSSRSWLDNDEQRDLFAERIGAAAQQSGLSRRRFLTALGFGGASALLAACGAANTAELAQPAVDSAAVSAQASAPAEGAAVADELQVFRFAYPNDPASHDYNKDLYCGGEPTLFAGLTSLSADYEAQPYAAQSWDVSEDGTVYTFHLHPEARWTNGDPVTAEDFVYSFTRQLNPETAASYAAILYDIKGAQDWNTGAGGGPDQLGLKAVDTYTLEITLNGPRDYFPLLVGYASALPAHRATVEQFGDKWTEVENIVSNGPFKLAKWEHNKQLEFERNEDFVLGPKPKLKRVIASIIPYNAGLLPYESGDLDFRENQGIPASEIARIQADPQLSQELVLVPTPAVAFLSPESNKPPFDQLGVRQALQHAINRETLLKVLNNLGEPAYSLVSQGQPYALPPSEHPDLTEAYRYDPELALSKLVGTPYEGGKNWPEVTLTLRPVGPTGRLAAEVIQQQLATNLNLNIQIDAPEDGKVFIANLYEGKYQFVFFIWYTDYPDPSNHYQAIWHGAASRRRFAWQNDKFDQLIEAAAGEINRVERAKQYLQAEQILVQEAAYIPLYFPLFPALFKPYIAGVPRNSNGAPVTDGSVYRGQKLHLYRTEEI
jgi:ABC-type oligopeptide transport system substrate-binding subunit